jgi:uracil DNA glycosylase
METRTAHKIDDIIIICEKCWIILQPPVTTNNSVRTAKETQRFSTKEISWLTLFEEVIAVYSENHTKPINILCGQNAKLLIIKASGTVTTGL